MHLLRLFLVFVATIVVFASPLAPADAEYLRLRQASIGPGQEDFPAYLDGDVGVYQHGESADGAFTTSNHLTLDITSAAAVNLGSTTTLIAQTEDEDDIPDDQFLRFKNTRCGGEDSVCCMGDRAYFSSGVGTAAWPCSMSIDTPPPQPTLSLEQYFN